MAAAPGGSKCRSILKLFTVCENNALRLNAFSHTCFCIERHNSHTVRLKSDSHNNMLPLPIYVNSVLPCLCLRHVARRAERNVTGGENKNTILLMPSAWCKWYFFTLCLLSRSRLRLFLCRQVLLLR